MGELRKNSRKVKKNLIQNPPTTFILWSVKSIAKFGASAEISHLYLKILNFKPQVIIKLSFTHSPLLTLLKLSNLTLHVVLLQLYGFSSSNVMPSTVHFNICWSIIGEYLWEGSKCMSLIKILTRSNYMSLRISFSSLDTFNITSKLIENQFVKMGA